MKILSLPEKHHLDRKPSCTRHHLEPDLNRPCSRIWRLWAWRLWAVVPGLFDLCDGQPPSWQLGGDPKQYQLYILRSYVRHDISEVQSQTLWVSMMPNCGSRQVTKNCIFSLQTHWASAKFGILATTPFAWCEIRHSFIQEDFPTYVDTLFFRQANYDRCDGSCIDAIPSFHFSLKQVAQLQSPWW